MRSRVMPGSSPTIDRREPVKRLNRVDLPTLGRPTIAKTGWLAVSAADSLFLEELCLDFFNLLADLTGTRIVPQRQTPRISNTWATLRPLFHSIVCNHSRPFAAVIVTNSAGVNGRHLLSRLRTRYAEGESQAKPSRVHHHPNRARTPHALRLLRARRRALALAAAVRIPQGTTGDGAGRRRS